LPGLARRLDIAFGEADLQQSLSSARLLRARVATLASTCDLDAAALDKVLARRQPAVDLPAAGAGRSVRQRGCRTPAAASPAPCCCANRPRAAAGAELARLTCELSIAALAEGSP